MKIEAKGPIIGDNEAWFYDWIGWKCTSPGKIARMLEDAAGDEVILEINSTGGSVMAGYEIYENLMNYAGKITAHVIIACSAATFLACAADETRISDGGIFMIHNVQSYAEGDYRDMQMEADALKQFNEGVINIYERKTGKTREELQQLMDRDTYMAPALAIEQGFVDGYIHERKESQEKQPEDVANFVRSVAASTMPMIPVGKLQELATTLKNLDVHGEVALAQLGENETKQNIGGNAGSDREKGGENKMTLEEFLAANAGEQAKIDSLINEARIQGATEERERLKSLDTISATVPSEMLAEAKYGETPMDGPTLAYQAMVAGTRAAAAYMADAMKDVEASGAESVGIGTPDAGQETVDESDEMANHVNQVKGRK